MIVDGQIGFLLGLLWCGVIGGLIAGRLVGRRESRRSLPPIGPRGSIRGAGSHAGPGALGASPPAVRRRA